MRKTEIEAKIEFINYKDTYKADLKRLTLEWLEKYVVSVGSEDIEFMDNPISCVVDKGGFVFLAKYHDEIVGTVSLYKLADNKYELAKLAVTEKYKGQKIGKQLMQVAINKCKEICAAYIILYTMKTLEAAYSLYLQLGFVEIAEERQRYIEAAIIMELDLAKIQK